MFMDNDIIKKINKVLWITILVTVAFNIVFLMRYNFEADSAFFVTLAQEQIRTKSLFPEGMYYSTGLFVLTPNLLVIPFLFVTDNLILARQLAILLLWLVIYILLYKVFVTTKEKNILGFIVSSSFFSLFYVDASVVSMHFYQGAYITYIIYQLLFIVLINGIITDNAYSNKKFLGIVLLYIIANLGEMRNLLIWGVPGVIAYVLLTHLKNEQQFEITKRMVCNLRLLSVLCISILLAFIVCIMVGKLYGTDGTMRGLTVLPAEYFGRSLYAIITDLFNLYGNSYKASLFSTAGIMKIINFLIAILFNIVMPLFAIRNINRFPSESSKFIIVFSIVSSFIYLFVIFLTGVASREDRYLIPVYNNNILLLAVTSSFVLKKHLKDYLPVGLCAILIYVFVCNFFYLSCQKHSLLYQKFGSFAEGVEGITNFLEEKGLQYGYATFFNAEEYSILSNNKVRIRGIRLNEKEIMPYNWLTSSRFYEPDYYSGKTFLMISDAEMEHFFPSGISKLDLGKPLDILKFKTFSFFVYGYNISSKFAHDK
jgi:hypothetical protein